VPQRVINSSDSLFPMLSTWSFFLLSLCIILHLLFHEKFDMDISYNFTGNWTVFIPTIPSKFLMPVQVQISATTTDDWSRVRNFGRVIFSWRTLFNPFIHLVA
jgi:hypothetical protein